MPSAVREPLRVPPAVSVSVIVLCAGTIFALLWPIHQIVGQIYALILLVLMFRYWPPMQQWFSRMPALHRATFVILAGSMIIGHFSLNGRTYFPFVAWEIFPFVREDDPVTCRQFVGTTASGRQVRLLVEQLFPSIVQFNPPDNESPGMDHLVHALANAYGRHHATDPIRRVDLIQVSVKLHPSKTDSHAPPSCELLKRYAISSALSN